MKKFMVVVLLFVSTYCYADNFKGYPFIKFETGPSLNVDNVYFAECIIGYKLKFWKIESQTYGGWLTWSSYDDQFNPFMEIYSINQKFIYNNFFIRYQHYCAHTINSEINLRHKYDEDGNYLYTKYNTSPYWWTGTVTTIGIGFEYDFK